MNETETIKALTEFKNQIPELLVGNMSTSGLVQVQILVEAITWSLERHTMQLVFGRVTSVSEYNRAAELARIPRRMLRLVQKYPGITRGKVMRRLKLTAPRIDAVVELLVDAHLIKVLTRPSRTRPAQVFYPVDKSGL